MNVGVMKALVREILTAPFRYDWTLQGFGMLRTHLPGDIRLNIWDNNFTFKPRPSMIHDHPWDFHSVIIVGELTNRTYEVGPETWIGMPYWERRIIPGIGGGQQQCEDRKTVLRQNGGDIYTAGQSYSQQWSDVHETSCLDGTITINFRDRANRPDVARVFFHKDSEWETAEPRKATSDEINEICNRSLDTWFK